MSFPWPVTDDELVLNQALDIVMRCFDLPHDEELYAGMEAVAGEAIMAEWRRGVRNQAVLANKAIAEVEKHHPLGSKLCQVPQTVAPQEENVQADWRKEQEQPMKLNSAQVKQTLSQFDAEVLPDDHPAVTQLNNLFGNHTFFLDGTGLKVLEPTETPDMEAQTGEVVSLADWSDATLTSLKPHEPELTGVVIVLEFKH